ncbi:PilN domain-containing protein [Kineococcus esterisolvens]|uniref:PilN domain-containing protein n=1 Tax=unclassified Kineococcus TaxID=2621656 RepID=UPI003D7DF053
MSFQTLEALATRNTVARVNLLPDGLDAARDFRRLQAGLGAGLLAVVGLVGVAYGIGAGHVATAEEAVADVQAQTLRLQAEQRQYADVPARIAEVEAAEAAERAVSAYDVSWFAMLDALAVATPQGVSLGSVSLALDAAAIAPDGTGTTTAGDPLSVAGLGTVTLTGKASSQALVADALEAVDTVEGVDAPFVSGTSWDETTRAATFTLSAVITDAALVNQR